MKLINNMDNINDGLWDRISTITEFDGGQLYENGTSWGNRTRTESWRSDDIAPAKPKTTTSLLIESLIKLICNTFEKDARLAQDCYNAICEEFCKINLLDESYTTDEFESIRSQYQMQIYKIMCAVRGQDLPIVLPSIQVDNKISTADVVWSRYRRDFEEISFIAHGGFGKVFKARHKLDSKEYAIKQIKINSTTIKLSHLAEVKTISGLNHPNIVQYKASWLEPYLNYKTPLRLNDSYRTSSENISNGFTANTSRTSQSFASSDDENSDIVEFVRSKSSNKSMSSSIAGSFSSKALCEFKNSSLTNYRARSKAAILYIQMDFCQWNLRSWLDERNSKTFEEFYSLHFYRPSNSEVNHLSVVNDIFCQLLSGLNYIHSRNVIHHDIKPSNIFLSMRNGEFSVVKLGDFGLACPLQSNRHGSALGTPLYAAPEQLNGQCTPKSDVYSLGIVLLELMLKFTTQMERIRTIEDARDGVLPTDLNVHSKKLIRNLLCRVRHRPDTSQIIKIINTLNNKKQNRNDQSQANKDSLNPTTTDNNNLKDKDAIIDELRAIISSKNNEIEQLKKALHEYKIKESNSTQNVVSFRKEHIKKKITY